MCKCVQEWVWLYDEACFHICIYVLLLDFFFILIYNFENREQEQNEKPEQKKKVYNANICAIYRAIE